MPCVVVFTGLVRCVVAVRKAMLSFKPPCMQSTYLTPQLLGMATAVRAEPAKYHDEHHSVLSIAQRNNNKPNSTWDGLLYSSIDFGLRISALSPNLEKTV